MATIVGLTRRMVIAQTARVGCQNGNFRNVPFSCDSLMYEVILRFPFCYSPQLLPISVALLLLCVDLSMLNIMLCEHQKQILSSLAVA